MVIIGGSFIDKFVIGLTGYYCSGKSTVEQILKEKHKFHIIDVDLIGHEALRIKQDVITQKFGLGILNSNNTIDRQKLGRVVFKNSKKLKILNSIVHPWMKEKIIELIKENSTKNLCISAALLFEMELDKFCDVILIIKSKLINIIRRAKQRDQRNICETLGILKKQKLMKFYKKYKKNDDIIIIKNDKTLLSLSQIIYEILTNIKNKDR